ncbi:hypothetical protein TorRG33x02_171490, partial [Trema orientale]
DSSDEDSPEIRRRVFSTLRSMMQCGKNKKRTKLEFPIDYLEFLVYRSSLPPKQQSADFSPKKVVYSLEEFVDRISLPPVFGRQNRSTAQAIAQATELQF